MQYCFSHNGDNIEWKKEIDALLIEPITESKTCLITGEPLTEPIVELNCGHKFNYLPLYKDVLNFKQKFFQQEINLLKTNEIQCPYCRKKQPELLPFFKMEGVKYVYGVNTLKKTPHCEYIFKQGPRKGQPCQCSMISIDGLCKKHRKPPS